MENCLHPIEKLMFCLTPPQMQNTLGRCAQGYYPFNTVSHHHSPVKVIRSVGMVRTMPTLK